MCFLHYLVKTYIVDMVDTIYGDYTVKRYKNGIILSYGKTRLRAHDLAVGIMMNIVGIYKNYDTNRKNTIYYDKERVSKQKDVMEIYVNGNTIGKISFEQLMDGIKIVYDPLRSDHS